MHAMAAWQTSTRSQSLGQTRHVIVPDLDYHAGMETMSGEIWAPPPSLCKLVSQRFQVGDSLAYSSVRGSERYTRGKETEGSTYPMQSRPDWYGSEGFGAKPGVHQISVHAVHTIVMGSDQQHALSLNIPPHYLEYFHRFVAGHMHWCFQCYYYILLLLSGFAVACMTELLGVVSARDRLMSSLIKLEYKDMFKVYTQSGIDPIKNLILKRRTCKLKFSSFCKSSPIMNLPSSTTSFTRSVRN